MNILDRVSALASIAATVLTFAGAAVAQSQVVVVEMFTSQGCSSCPPADEIFSELAKQDDVVALGLHVHYWDYLGWKDAFAQEKFATRQEYLNMNIPSRYRRVTPQMIFNGQAQVAGARVNMIERQLRAIRAQKPLADIDMATRGNRLELRLNSLSGQTRPSDIHLVHYLKRAVVPIERGENRGRTVSYANIVSSWETIGEWNGKSPLTLSYTLKRNEPFAVIVQAKNFGRIYTAQRMD
jgi:hypothetical protein